jgi:hypothetical protein
MRFGRPAELDAPGRHHDRPVNEDRVRHHGIEQLRIAQGFIGQAELRVGRTLFP